MYPSLPDNLPVSGPSSPASSMMVSGALAYGAIVPGYAQTQPCTETLMSLLPRTTKPFLSAGKDANEDATLITITTPIKFTAAPTAPKLSSFSMKLSRHKRLKPQKFC